MDEITSYIKLVCVVSIASGVLMTLIPKGRLKGSFISLCAVVTVSAMVMPFNGMSVEGLRGIEWSVTDNADSLSEKTQQAEKELYESAIALATEENLKNEGVTASVSVESDKQEEGYTIKAVTVSGDFTEAELGVINNLLSSCFTEAKITIREVSDD